MPDFELFFVACEFVPKSGREGGTRLRILPKGNFGLIDMPSSSVEPLPVMSCLECPAHLARRAIDSCHAIIGRQLHSLKLLQCSSPRR